MTLHDEPARNRSDGVKFVAAKTSDAGDPSIGTGPHSSRRMGVTWRLASGEKREGGEACGREGSERPEGGVRGM